ncbi:MAG: bifunctional diaminohydroxyphosphoribosylaminopyrimidine deaminase/5-amino-6-(5-phosphoribosylamino)uracil reductase RibD [Fibrobacteres bacterium]|nr:bifunctional diaminohydroxyphosphoribosylaminopyrimidine deaminase/5-amino-6-(5-phosphoribosylamino)uracil reductase RibD [Fibrobacterota bacterium]
MKRALSLARHIKGKTGDNPAVGAVIYKGNRIISTGHTHEPGADHAEKDALKKADKAANGASMAVTLEPCRHFGRTPPCTRAIIKAGIKKVTVAVKDPNPLMAGRGIADLKKAGIEVSSGLLAKEAEEINRDFFKYIKTGRPFVALKAACTLNGMIAADSGDSKWVTGEQSRKLVHKLRSEYDSIMVGMNTVLKDDPMLDVRLCKGRNPVRIILSKGRDLPINSKIAKSADKIRTILITSKNIKNKKCLFVEYITIPSNKGLIPIKKVLTVLGKLQIKSLIVEGGSAIHTAFMKEKAFDCIYLFLAPKLLESGIPWIAGKPTKFMAESLELKDFSIKKVGKEVLLTLSL